MKKRVLLGGVLAALTIAGCSGTDTTEAEAENKGYAGVYEGVSWRGEASGITLEEATQKLKTTLTLSEEGIIEDIDMNFLVLKNGEWQARNNSESSVTIDYSVDPTAAVLGEDYSAGQSMFDVKTNDMMSFYALGVDTDGTVAFGIVDAVIRYKLEMKLDADFDYNSTLETVTIGNGLVPTVRTSTSGLIKPSDWSELEGADLFAIHPWNHVISDYGVLEGIDEMSTVREMLETLGVEFEDGKPKAMEATYGFHSNGGWKGNYDSIADYLRGKDVNEITTFVDWSNPKYAQNITEENFFGVDRIAGATRTAQNSLEGMAGATVRISRENTSYQRALVEAGVISEGDVIKGRF